MKGIIKCHQRGSGGSPVLYSLPKRISLNFVHMNEQTIAAIATASGTGAIGIVRLSGSEAILIADRIFKGKKLKDQSARTVHFGSVLSPIDGSVIDEVVVVLFRGPHSFTGEDIVEINGHGSPYVLQKILEACLQVGAVSAKPGEFTQRAFLNGKLDLTQAEAVADLIAAENKAAHELALNQMKGGVSSELAVLREDLVNFTALIELELDFSDEDVEFADRTQLKELIQKLQTKIKGLIKSFEYGNAVKNGVPVAIIGKPNAGKSTLLNALLQEERAIVSDIAGTTRDVIEEAITLNGITFRFIDTAGIRHTEDRIEAIGVERAIEKVQQAKVVIHLYEESDELLEELAASLKEKVVFNLQSKCDDPAANARDLRQHSRSKLLEASAYSAFPISVKTGYNLDRLTRELTAYFKEEAAAQSVVITNVRHKEALERSLAALTEVDNGMERGLSGDLLSLHLKDALYHLGSITGRIDIDKDILGTIFGKFCIGK